MMKIWTCLLLIVYCVELVHGGIEVISGPDRPIGEFGNALVSSFRNIGDQSEGLETIGQAVYVHDGNIDWFCQQMLGIEENELSGKVVLFDFNVGIACGVGNALTLEHNRYLCNLNATIVSLFNIHTYNAHPGDFFESIFVDDPDLKRSCRIYSINPNKEEQLLNQFRIAFLANPGANFEVKLRTDTNVVFQLFESFGYKFLTRGVYGFGYLGIMLLAIYHWRERRVKGVLSFVHKVMLASNIFACCALGLVEVCGSHFYSDVLPAAFTYMFYANMNGIAVGNDFFQSLLLRDSVRIGSSFGGGKHESFMRRNSFFVTIGATLFLIDGACALAIPTLDLAALTSLVKTVPAVFCTFQIAIMIYLGHTTSVMVSHLNANDANLVENESNSLMVHLKRRLIFYCRLSILFSTIYIIALVLMATTKGFQRASSTGYLVNMHLWTITRLGNAFCQVEFCRCPKRARLKTKMTVAKTHVQTTSGSSSHHHHHNNHNGNQIVPT